MLPEESRHRDLSPESHCTPECLAEQDVAPKDAGTLLALTNSASTLVGFAANLITGALAASTFGYTAVFGLTIAFYLASCLSWNLAMRGQEILL